MQEESGKNVCSSGWTGAHGSTVTLKNDNANPVDVNYSSDPKFTWPFTSPNSPFTIRAKVGSNPGTQPVVLQNKPSGPSISYGYDTKGCPGDKALVVNPKTVIIT